MNTNESTQTLDNLQALYAAGYQDSFFDHALRKLVERQIAQDEERLRRLTAPSTWNGMCSARCASASRPA